MKDAITSLSLDLQGEGMPPVIEVQQYDTARSLEIHLSVGQDMKLQQLMDYNMLRKNS